MSGEAQDWSFDPIAWLHDNVSPSVADEFRAAWKKADSDRCAVAGSPFPYAEYTTTKIETSLKRRTLSPTSQWAEGYRCAALDFGVDDAHKQEPT